MLILEPGTSELQVGALGESEVIAYAAKVFSGMQERAQERVTRSADGVTESTLQQQSEFATANSDQAIEGLLVFRRVFSKQQWRAMLGFAKQSVVTLTQLIDDGDARTAALAKWLPHSSANPRAQGDPDFRSLDWSLKYTNDDADDAYGLSGLWVECLTSKECKWAALSRVVVETKGGRLDRGDNDFGVKKVYGVEGFQTYDPFAGTTDPAHRTHYNTGWDQVTPSNDPEMVRNVGPVRFNDQGKIIDLGWRPEGCVGATVLHDWRELRAELMVRRDALVEVFFNLDLDSGGRKVYDFDSADAEGVDGLSGMFAAKVQELLDDTFLKIQKNVRNFLRTYSSSKGGESATRGGGEGVQWSFPQVAPATPLDKPGYTKQEWDQEVDARKKAIRDKVNRQPDPRMKGTK